MFGFFRKRNPKGLTLLQQERSELKSKYSNTPIAPLKSPAKMVDKETVPGTAFASQCPLCGAFNMHMLEKDKAGLIALICTKCNEVYEVEKIADSP
mgnify:CR=1 FL=1